MKHLNWKLALLALITPCLSRASTLPAAGNTVGKTVSLYGVNLSGGEFGNVGGVYGQAYIYPDLATMQYFAGKGMKLIRVPFKWERVQPQLLGALDSADVARLHQVFTDANTAGVGILLDMHNYGQYQLPSGAKPYIGEDPTVTIAAYKDVWQKLAKEFENDSALLGYDIMNEPQGFSNPNGRSWFIAAQAAVDAIRSTDLKTTIYVEGDCWASAANWSNCNNGLSIQDPATNFIYSAHQYFDAIASGNYDGTTYDNQGVTPTTGVDRVTGFVQWLKNNNARGHIGEYGVPNNDARYLVTLKNMMDYLVANCVSGTDWAAGPWWGSYLLSVQPNNGVDQPQMAVLSQYGVKACTQSTYNPPPSPTPTPVPTPNPTPVPTPSGNIQTIGSSGTTVIDITKPSSIYQMRAESSGAAFDYSSSPGGYLEFTLQVAAAGAYTISLNQASWTANTGVEVSVNGAAATTIIFSSTGNSWTYAATPATSISLPLGVVKLRVTVAAAGQTNLAGISLTAAASTPAPTPSGNIQTVAASGTTVIDITKPTSVYQMRAESSGASFDYSSSPGGYLEFALQVKSAGFYTAKLNQASWTANTGASFSVNGTSAGAMIFSQTGNSWTYAWTPGVAITLPAGTVVLRVTASLLGQMNLAGLTLSK